ncbi:hypothetical protein CYV19_15940 [Natronobacterium gregoryi SP2]|uniref:Uncharacterized protein n=1 Tax=Natronobacterium gregoryi (strain ATCC 43098 / DSM 3393 / CCM 3738 / CIP 104747 / IAM 13177 / JCM 8860 / NBRC 102187 / NCIMB 2189 / SP2) TaxID=797304 RepID=L0AJ12_NATGS|nr:hypothetical protein [Natronobacterium gregoryi]AFZ73791.1 hypothetical protein Natgr_2642 [Natronobacterium gregoryi SP2]ELY65277.1 hypothetical protein C490_13750 [Natronobacterium gregoryi SP2]PLK19234.1 hypothetical protein CYV19_15940 [Natronobacterium gregoryi SP2]
MTNRDAGDREDPCEGLDEVESPVTEVRPTTESVGESVPVGDASAAGESDDSELDELESPASEVRPVAEQDVDIGEGGRDE